VLPVRWQQDSDELSTSSVWQSEQQVTSAPLHHSVGLELQGFVYWDHSLFAVASLLKPKQNQFGQKE